ncbi:MAG: nitroreductase family protein [Abditibacteriota bacterium]|nr:nitroreductase family protein [Abditibacteriota bacterium]
MEKYDFLGLAAERYSCRKYKPEPLSREEVETLLKAAALAPTGCNLQPWRIMVIRSAEGLAKAKRATSYTFDAPCILAVMACNNEGWTRRFDGKSCRVIDAAIVTTHIILQAAAMGLGTCWVMSFDPKAFAEDFGLDASLEPVALVPVGRPAEDARPSGLHSVSRDIKELVSYK